MSKFKTQLMAAMVALSLGMFTANVAWSLTNEQIVSIRQTFSLTTSAIHDVLAGVADYSTARAADDEYGMHRATAEMLSSMAEARIWTALLDAQVTADDVGAATAQSVADLRALLATTFGNLANAMFSGDLDAINTALDASSNRFNQLFVDMTALSSDLGPRLGAAR